MDKYKNKTAHPYYFLKIKLLVERINKLEHEFRFCTTVKDFKERKLIENDLGCCYRKLMNSVKKERLKNIIIEDGVMQITILER